MSGLNPHPQGGEALPVRTFNFNGNAIRVIQDSNGDPWFQASEVCAVLQIKNPTDALSRLDEDEKATLDSTEGGPARNIISESGLYSLVLGSRKKVAKTFKRWVTHVVLPSIRRTGSYSAPVVALQPQAPTGLDIVGQIGQALGILAQTGKEHEAQILRLQTDQQTLASKVEAMETRQAEVAEMAGLLPDPTVDAPDLPARGALNAIIRSHAVLAGITFQEAWNNFYQQIYYRAHIDVKARAKKRQITPMSVIEEDGLMETAYAIAVGVYGKGAVS